MDFPSNPLAKPATREKLGIRRAGVLMSIFFGASVTEAVSVNLLPLTLTLFTRDPNVIFWILAINPAFGFIAQPLVGLLSDHVWTRIGRRAVFLVLAGPMVACSLVAIPYVETFAVLVLVVVILQFFQDVINGSDQPLLADSIPPEQRTLALGLVKAAENTGFLLVLLVGMPMVDAFREPQGANRYGLPLYLLAAVCQLLFVVLAAFFLREQPITRQARPRLTLRRYVSDFFHQSMLPRIASAYFLRAFARTAVVGSVALFAHHTLRLSEQEFGTSWGWMPFIALISGIPLGLLAERFAKHRVLQVAFLLLIVGCAVGYSSKGVWMLVIAALVFGIGDMLLEVTHKAFMSEYYPADLIGQLSGTVNCFYAAGRTAALIVVGLCVKLANPSLDWQNVTEEAAIDYSIIWIISAVAAVLGILILSTTRDFRHEIRTQAHEMA